MSGTMTKPMNINPVEWHQAIGLARQSCARIYRDGGTPGDAMRLHGLRAGSADRPDWNRAIGAIALSLCGGAR